MSFSSWKKHVRRQAIVPKPGWIPAESRGFGTIRCFSRSVHEVRASRIAAELPSNIDELRIEFPNDAVPKPQILAEGEVPLLQRVPKAGNNVSARASGS